MAFKVFNVWHCYVLLLVLAIFSFGVFCVADREYQKATIKDEANGIFPSNQKMQLFDLVLAFGFYTGVGYVLSLVIFSIWHCMVGFASSKLLRKYIAVNLILILLIGVVLSLGGF